MKTTWFAAIIYLLLAVAAVHADDRPNIVVMVADDLGYTDVGFHGSDIKTAHLDRLAASGARLEAFYVQPVCSPTRAALMTGRYPMRHGLQVGVVRPWAQYGLPLEERTLPQALAEAGYFTAICGKWHLGHFKKDYLPTRRGFHHQYGHYNGALDYFTHVRDGGFDWHRNDQVCHDEGYTTILVGNECVRLIEQHDSSRPLFLYVPFNAPHSPLQAPEEYLDRYSDIQDSKRRTYSAMVHCVDDQVGRIVAALEARGMRENTLIVFSSDNGGPLNLGATNGSLRAGKGTLYEGGVRVTALANWPGKIRSDTVVSEPLHMVDWYPTLLKLARASLDQPLAVDGRDAWRTIIEGAPSPHEEILLNTTPGNGAIRAGDWKLIVNGNRPEDGSQTESPPGKSQKKGKRKVAGGDSVELFNVVDDPNEKRNLAADHPEKVQQLRGRLEEYARQAVPPKLAPKAPDFVTPKVWGE